MQNVFKYDSGDAAERSVATMFNQGIKAGNKI
jgi:hypothetical protein